MRASTRSRTHWSAPRSSFPPHPERTAHAGAAAYRRREPTATLLYPLVQRRLETFLAEAAEADPGGRINRIIKSPIYKGTHTFNFGDGTRVERPFPALVTSEAWEGAQETLRQNALTGGAAGAKRTYLLRGKVKCAGCGTTAT